MARVALLKLFTGLNLGVSQLSGELQRAGHDSRIIYFKDFLVVPRDEAPKYLMSDYPGILVGARGAESVWNCYRPITEQEYQHLLGYLREFDPQLIGMSLTSLPIRAAAEVVTRLKAELGVPIIWGGSGPTLEPERCIQLADMICINEGEQVIVDLANRIDAGEDLTTVPGTWAKQNGEIIRNPARQLMEVEDLAVPDFDPGRTVRINDDRIERDIYPPNLGSQYAIMTTRGCPFSCSFCIESVYQDMFGKKNHLRRRSVDVVIAELVEAKKKYPISSVMFYDDVFTTHPRWLKEFAERYKAEVGLPFWCYTYPTTTKRSEIEMLRDAGCVSMTMGIQSGSEEILNDGMNRPVPQQKAIEAAQILLDCGIECYFDLITKVHLESEKHARETFEFLCDLPPGMKTVGFGVMTAFPGYGYTRKVEEGHHEVSMNEREYAYYHRLYLLTRTELPRGLVRAIGKIPVFRRFPNLLEPLLPKQLPVFFIGDKGSDEILNLPHAQAVIPGGELDRGL